MYQKLNWTWRVKYAKVYKMRLTVPNGKVSSQCFLHHSQKLSHEFIEMRDRDRESEAHAQREKKTNYYYNERIQQTQTWANTQTHSLTTV